ncbi:unnamed protein product [Cuscuta campestris]|uniref:cyclic pyranopterin monophosphate synthase n=1 Tax=Cuscuta campestris TaxID=132261 RepID=A0A484N2J0_9ASTE|nr:unnamed protein product [Cuscuta campestris]
MFLRRVASKLPQSARFFCSTGNRDLSNAIAELNKEMESIFGEPPPSSFSGAIENQDAIDEPCSIPPKDTGNDLTMPMLTHVSKEGEAKMVDISCKGVSHRVAVASCKVILGRKVFDLVSANEMGKGDVLGVAKIAGICGAKQTSTIIPLCHNINLTHVRVDLALNPKDLSVEIEGEASARGETGVEMEALAAVTVAGLTVYDMCKAASKDIRITDVKLEWKTGGKSGDWSREK